MSQIEAPSDLFGRFNVKELTESDFYGKKFRTPTALKSNRCHIILFYDVYDRTSSEMREIWLALAQSIAGPVIAAVNTSAREEVMQSFYDTANDLDNPLNDFTIRGTPTILVYRNGWPQAYYNGELSFDALKKWILVLACQPGYKERDSRFTGVASVVSDQYVSDPRTEAFAFPTSSRDFTATIGEGTRSSQPAPIQETTSAPEIQEEEIIFFNEEG